VIHCWGVTHPNVVHFDVSVTLTLVCACPTSPPFQDARAANPSHNLSQPAVVLRKRRPSQREGLPTKDLCTPTPQTKSNSCHPPQSEGSAVLNTGKPGAPHLSPFEMWLSASGKTPQINHPARASMIRSCTADIPVRRRVPNRQPRHTAQNFCHRAGVCELSMSAMAGCASWKIAG
jgi:hypothetical protein